MEKFSLLTLIMTVLLFSCGDSNSVNDNPQNESNDTTKSIDQHTCKITDMVLVNDSVNIDTVDCSGSSFTWGANNVLLEFDESSNSQKRDYFLALELEANRSYDSLTVYKTKDNLVYFDVRTKIVNRNSTIKLLLKASLDTNFTKGAAFIGAFVKDKDPRKMDECIYSNQNSADRSRGSDRIIRTVRNGDPQFISAIDGSQNCHDFVISDFELLAALPKDSAENKDIGTHLAIGLPNGYRVDSIVNKSMSQENISQDSVYTYDIYVSDKGVSSNRFQIFNDSIPSSVSFSNIEVYELWLYDTSTGNPVQKKKKIVVKTNPSDCPKELIISIE